MDDWSLATMWITIVMIAATLIGFVVMKEYERGQIIDQQKNERCLELIKVGQYAGCGS